MDQLVPERNWGQNHAVRAVIAHPTGVEELQELVAQTGCGRGDPGIRSMTSPTPRELWQFLTDWMRASS
jgi:hypothetical protein